MLLYRLRSPLLVVLVLLGFWAPWNNLLALDPPGANAHVWGLLAVNLSQAHWMSITSAFNLLLAIGIALAVMSACLSTWGAAYVGTASAASDASRPGAESSPPGATSVLREDGPYRHLRHPVYSGMFLHIVALSLLMPRSGAIFAIVTTGVLQWLLGAAEDRFLGARLGQTFTAYRVLVPGFFPSFRPRIQGQGQPPQWAQAFARESYLWLVALAFAAAGWQYNAHLLMQCVLVAFGISLVVQALLAKPVPRTQPAEQAQG